MTGRILLGIAVLSCVACSQAQQQSGHALNNANSVVRTIAPKVWNAPGQGGQSANQVDTEEEQRRQREERRSVQ